MARSAVRSGLQALMFLSAAFGVPTAQADQTDEIVAAREAYLAARDGEGAVKRALERVARDAQGAAEQIGRLLDANTESYDRLLAEIADANEAIKTKLVEQISAEAVPAGLKDEYLEARRRYDEARPVFEIIARSQLISDLPEWRAIQDHIVRLSREVGDAQARGAARAAEIGREIPPLEARRAALLGRLEQAIQVPSGGPAFDRWARAAADLADALEKARAAEVATTVAFDAYALAVRPDPPAWLRRVVVTAGGRETYRASWRVRRDGDDDPVERLRRAMVREPVEDLGRVIADIEQERREQAEKRLQLAYEMRPLNLRLDEYAATILEMGQKKVIAAALVEMVGVIVETALTGGAATAARKAQEMAQEAAINTFQRQAARRAAGARGAQLARMELQLVGKEVVEREAAAVARRLESPWAALRQALAQRARERALREGANPELAARAALAQFAAGQNRMAELAALQGRWDARASLLAQGLEAPLRKIEVALGSKKGADVLTNTETYKQVSSIVKNEVVKDTAGVVVSDLIEAGFARGGVFVLKEGVSRSGAAALRIAEEGVKGWQAVRTGAAAFAGAPTKLPHLKEALGSAKGNLLALGTTAAKAAVTAYFSAQEWAADAAFWETMAELDGRYEIYLRQLEADRGLLRIWQENQRRRAELLGFINAVTGPREKRILADDRPEEGDGELELQLGFATALEVAPKVTLGGVAVAMAAVDATPGGAETWRGRVATDRLPAGESEVTLEVDLAAAQDAFEHLDGDPETHAHIDMRADLETKGRSQREIWAGYDPGPDRSHRIKLADPYAGLWRRGDTVLRLARRGDEIEGTIEVPSATARERGFAEGMTVMRGRVEGRALVARVLVRYEKVVAERCPGSEFWADVRYDASERDVLKGSWENRPMDDGCVVKGREPVQDRLARRARGSGR
ncbi:MAG: hypothetical protein IT561_18885 [Alphaproteobacteria bacterium]|nr:hypothetical protein [Alphaproteobacteria bacterium]